MPPILNTLGDLTNRENRAFAPRFANDYDKNGLIDDYNTGASGVAGDGVPDYYPTLYPGVFSYVNPVTGQPLANLYGYSPLSGMSYSAFAFPYIYPGAYSRPDPSGIGSTLGWIHGQDPTQSAINPSNLATMQNYLLKLLNHNPIDVGDSLPVPTATTQYQTWWGFPTWRETLSTNWLDPVWQLNVNGTQATGLIPFAPTSIPSSTYAGFLPPMSNFQLFCDGAGSATFSAGYTSQAVWEDDLLMTGVRSFDVKGYDSTVSNYMDLGYNAAGLYNPNYNAAGFPNLGIAMSALQSLGHEGLIPPRSIDFRYDPQAETKGLFYNIGDDQTGVIRLQRTWDTWSTTYTEAPADGYNPNNLLPYGLSLYSQPVYPSYPAPYPVPLRGLQIQVRVVDPRNERIKVLTIRQDFSDKIYNQQ